MVRLRINQLILANFLSYRHAVINLGDLTALVGVNASGKSNAVAALKLLRDIVPYGLPTALARRGGYDQMRHRTERGRPLDSGITVKFQSYPDFPESVYELQFGAVRGGKYRVRLERGMIHGPDGTLEFEHKDELLDIVERSARDGGPARRETYPIPAGQSAVTRLIGSLGGYSLYQMLTTLQVVEINPTRIGDLQDPDSTETLAPDGSNAASYVQLLSNQERAALVDELASLVPGIVQIGTKTFSDKVTLTFTQETESGERRQFFAKQMSDGTLRAFGILLAMARRRSRTSLLAVEEPETAIHLGALRTLVDLLQQHAQDVQVLMTTHSADIIDALAMDQLRVVHGSDGTSRVSSIAEHTKALLQQELMTPGELLRSDALDPATA